ncbi:MAG: rhodanese-like domain-containing protein [Sulfurovaceae bacterium]|nr:rhodanese-like domain-containing protein [Sulfurovaceae bacterium]MDD5548711.1 rhodanese-like domain-containing protein [Sulfurovaceae bacterium]
MKMTTGIALIGSILTTNLLFGAPINKISPTEAFKLIGNKNVVFVSGDDNETYEAFHIKDSIEMYAHHLHHSDKMGNMHCAPLYRCPTDAQNYISSKGIRNDQMIIAYDSYKGPNATGVYSFFESFGHKNLKFLDGGMDGIKSVDPMQVKYDALKKEKKAIKKQIEASKDKTQIAKFQANIKSIETQMAALEPKMAIQPGVEPKYIRSNYKIDPKAINKTYIADKDEVKKAVFDIMKNGKKSKFVVIDSRSMDEIIGEKKMDNVARGGHIPGATFIEWKQISDEENSKPFKSKTELQKVFDKAGVKKDQIIYAYCQVGAGRGSHIVSALRELGYENVKVFTGSWDVWGNDMSLPIRR